MWLHPDVFWIGVLHAKKKGKWEKMSKSEDENVPVGTHSDNTSILVPSPNGLVP